MNINPNRPIEKLVGDNYGITRKIVNRCHVGLSLLQVAREARPTNMRKAPPKLRRGWALCVMETHFANQGLFYRVAKGYNK